MKEVIEMVLLGGILILMTVVSGGIALLGMAIQAMFGNDK